MPQLLSRRDEHGWLTPSMADILMQGTSPLPGEVTLREQISEIQNKFESLNTPIRIVDVRPSPSRNLYIVRLESRRGRDSGMTDIRRSLGRLDDDNEDWTLGFMSAIQDDPNSVGILLRTPQHEPLHLRQLLLSNAYQHQRSTFTIVMGVTPEQQIVVRDLAQIAPLLVIGPNKSRRHFIRAALTTLAMLNTPTELRFTLLGESASQDSEIMGSPHALGRLIDSADPGRRLLEGMSKEVQRRHQWMVDAEVDSLDAYNQRLLDQDKTPLPRIALLLSSLSDVEWHAAIESIQESLYNILVNGPRVGVLPIITADSLDDVPEELAEVVDTRLIMRSAGLELAEEITHLHTTALRFVDAFIMSQRDPNAVTAVELCAVNDQDIQHLVSYWRQLAAQRAQEARPRERTGLTDLLPDLEGSGLGQAQDRPTTGSIMPTRTRAGALARATQALTTEADETLVAQAMTLAAYLGWIGVGPLRDIFGVSASEARSTIASLQRMGVVEDGDATILRFIRLAENPLDPGS